MATSRYVTVCNACFGMLHISDVRNRYITQQFAPNKSWIDSFDFNHLREVEFVLTYVEMYAFAQHTKLRAKKPCLNLF
jgi:hypothetical protein